MISLAHFSLPLYSYSLSRARLRILLHLWTRRRTRTVSRSVRHQFPLADKGCMESERAGAERSYVLIARQAEILLMEDGPNFDPNRAGELYNEAAEAAMEEMKGKLATK